MRYHDKVIAIHAMALFLAITIFVFCNLADMGLSDNEPSVKLVTELVIAVIIIIGSFLINMLKRDQ